MDILAVEINPHIHIHLYNKFIATITAAQATLVLDSDATVYVHNIYKIHSKPLSFKFRVYKEKTKQFKLKKKSFQNRYSVFHVRH